MGLTPLAAALCTQLPSLFVGSLINYCIRGFSCWGTLLGGTILALKHACGMHASCVYSKVAALDALTVGSRISYWLLMPPRLYLPGRPHL